MAKTLEEMGQTELNAVKALKACDNNMIEVVKKLGMATRPDIDYYIDITTKMVRD